MKKVLPLSNSFKRIDTQVLGPERKRIEFIVPDYTGRAKKIEVPDSIFNGDNDELDALANERSEVDIFSEGFFNDNIFSCWKRFFSSSIALNLLSNRLLKFIQKGAKRGDIIRLPSVSDDPNQGCFIYDGDKLVDLCYDCDDSLGYGLNSLAPSINLIPIQFEVVHEFPIDYWLDAIDYSKLVWFDPRPYTVQTWHNIKNLGTDIALSDISVETKEDMANTWFIDWRGKRVNLLFPAKKSMNVLSPLQGPTLWEVDEEPNTLCFVSLGDE